MAPLGSSAAGRYHAQGTSVMEEDGGEHCLITPPTNLAGRESNRQPLGYKSDALTAYPRLPRNTSVTPAWESYCCCLLCITVFLDRLHTISGIMSRILKTLHTNPKTHTQRAKPLTSPEK